MTSLFKPLLHTLIISTFIITQPLNAQRQKQKIKNKMDKEFLNKWIHEISYESSGKDVNFEEINNLSEFIAFNNPNRESWEKTSEMLNYLNIKDNEIILLQNSFVLLDEKTISFLSHTFVVWNGIG